jgi:carboxypeptidase Taq
MKTMPDFAPYQKLCERFREIALVGGVAGLLSWDQDTYMPPKAAPFRADQLACLSGWRHRLAVAPEVNDWIKACEDHGFPTGSKEAVNTREWRRDYDREAKLPQALVEDFQRTSSLARMAWVTAREKSEFPVFEPHLAKLLALTREKAEHWGYEESIYDALLAGYEPGVRAAQLRALFAELRPAVVMLLGQAAGRNAKTPGDLLSGHYPIARQQAFNHDVAAAIGFDFEAGRIDTTAHPFCAATGLCDTRLTTRYDAHDFSISLYGVLHEAGHGLYDQGLPEGDYATPAGEAVSLGIHESQSRLWENKVGCANAFWEHWLPTAARHLPDLARFSPTEITAAVNRVSPSFIRVEADEVTYDLHIILRFELELRLLEGSLAVADLPGAWNEEFKKMLGLEVPDDARGCLQDIHWSLGIFGYFPTYTLGNLNSAQLFAAARKQVAGLDAQLAQGRYSGLLNWLRANVHAHGRCLRPQELMQRATGEPTQISHHVEYLRTKLGAL